MSIKNCRVNPQDLRALISLPTSPLDLYEISGKKYNVFQYKDILKFDDIDDLFEEDEKIKDIPYDFDENNVILLYNSAPNFGHWCCLNRNKYGYNFLDSYGGTVDKSLDYNEKEFKYKKHLAKLLSEASGDVYYNHLPLQKLSNNIATCGRYCAVYLRYDDLNIDDFAKNIKKLAKNLKLTCDELIVYLSII